MVALIRVVTTELGRNGGEKGWSVLKIKKAGGSANGLEESKMTSSKFGFSN